MSLKLFSGLQDFLGRYDQSILSFRPISPLEKLPNSTASSTTVGSIPLSSTFVRSVPNNNREHLVFAPKRTAKDINLENTWSEDDSAPITQCSHQRKVHFSDEEELISGWMTPYESRFTKGHYNTNAISLQTVLEAYNKACARMKINPSANIERQIACFHNVPSIRQQSLILKGERTTHSHMECLEEIFRYVQFESVDFECAYLDDETMVILADLLEFYDSALRLNVSCNQQVKLRGWQAFFRMLKNNRSLTSLNLRSTSLTERSVPLLARTLKADSPLSILHLENCSLSGKSMLLLVCALKMNTALRELYLGDNSLTARDGAHLHQLIIDNVSIRTLDLRNNHLQDLGLRHICDALRDPDRCKRGRLSSLVLWNNRLTNVGMVDLAAALMENHHLETLNLGCNSLGSEGMQYLKEALAKNRTLRRLGLQATKLTCQSAIVLAESIADNRSLLRLDLRDNGDIRSAGLLALHLAMKLNSHISSLNLDRITFATLSSSKMTEYSEQFRRYFEEIQEFCARNRKAAISRMTLVSIPSDNSNNGQINSGNNKKKPADKSELFARKPSLLIPGKCFEVGHDRDSHEDAISRPASSPTCSALIVHPCSRLSQPGCLHSDGILSRPPSDRSNPERIVAGVVSDLVNFCVYELEDFCFVSSVGTKMRPVIREFGSKLTQLVDRNCESAARTLKRTSAFLKCNSDQDREIAVEKIVRDLIKSVILRDRDALRKSVKQKKHILYKCDTGHLLPSC